MFLPDDSQIADAVKHLEMSEEALYKELAQTDADFAFGEDAFEWGKRRFRNARGNLAELVCRDQRIKDIFARGAGNRRLLLFCAIVDLVQTAGAASIAALLVKEGLETYCAGIWKPEAGG
jgi:hypothetical protein